MAASPRDIAARCPYQRIFMHEVAFAKAALPRRVTVFGLPLRPYSIAHELWLIARNNPLIQIPTELSGMNSALQRRALMEAVLICHHSHAELLALDNDWLLGLKMKFWRWRTRNEDVALGIADFRNYLAQNSTCPPTVERPERPGESAQRAQGTPFIQRLLHFLIFEVGIIEDMAMDYQKGLAMWHLCAWLESRQALNIPNEGETNSGAMMDFALKLEEAGVGYEEAFLRARARFESANIQPPSSSEAPITKDQPYGAQAEALADGRKRPTTEGK